MVESSQKNHEPTGRRGYLRFSIVYGQEVRKGGRLDQAVLKWGGAYLDGRNEIGEKKQLIGGG